jgi:hypothetical protein
VIRALPIKREYGPTLGQLLSPRWRAASRTTRALATAAAAGLLVLALALPLALENAHYSRGGEVPFSFSYRGLYRALPDAGGYVKVERLGHDGRLEDSFAVAPLRLEPYAGWLVGELPVFASSRIAALAGRYPNFVLRAEGKTRVNTVPAYQVIFTATVGGQTMFGRDVLLFAQRPNVRKGVEITMLTTPTASRQVSSPLEVASAGLLLRPLKTFTLH